MTSERRPPSPPDPALHNSVLARRLCVFARAPVLGQVKSRLAAAIGDQAALEAHIRLVEHTLEQIGGTGGVGHCASEQRELWIGGDIDAPLVRRWNERFAFALQQQCAGDLGARMRHALAAHAAGGGSVLIGSDCPAIDTAYIEAAFEALLDADVVLGPTEDGGYGLIGTCRDLPGLFVSMPWSTDQVLAETRERCSGLGLRCVLLPMIWDVDTAVDWQRFLRQARSSD